MNKPEQQQRCSPCQTMLKESSTTTGPGERHKWRRRCTRNAFSVNNFNALRHLLLLLGLPNLVSKQAVLEQHKDIQAWSWWSIAEKEIICPGIDKGKDNAFRDVSILTRFEVETPSRRFYKWGMGHKYKAIDFISLCPPVPAYKRS